MGWLKTDKLWSKKRGQNVWKRNQNMGKIQSKMLMKKRSKKWVKTRSKKWWKKVKKLIRSLLLFCAYSHNNFAAVSSWKLTNLSTDLNFKLMGEYTAPSHIPFASPSPFFHVGYPKANPPYTFFRYVSGRTNDNFSVLASILRIECKWILRITKIAKQKFLEISQTLEIFILGLPWIIQMWTNFPIFTRKDALNLFNVTGKYWEDAIAWRFKELGLSAPNFCHKCLIHSYQWGGPPCYYEF